MILKTTKLFFEIILLLLIVFCFAQYKLVLYGLMQGKGQLSITWNAVPIEIVLKGNSFPDSLKQKLKLIQEIKTFTEDSLGLLPSKNYSTFYLQPKNPELYTVSACQPFSFKPKEWTFPFVGTVSYKGFFNKNEAKKEINSLHLQGYDVDVYSPSGWSTLGWFTDPVLSGMLKRSDGGIANLIIHELTHGTIYIRDNVTFNENLASFIGDKGAEQFLINKYGMNSKQYITYVQTKTDTKCFDDYMLKATERLDSLYHTFKEDENELTKKQMKQKLISEIVLGVNHLNIHNKKSYFNYSLQAFAEGNAFFMAFSRYDSQYETFEKEFIDEYHSDLKAFIEAMRKVYR